jgi:hypothetical protein
MAGNAPEAGGVQRSEVRNVAAVPSRLRVARALKRSRHSPARIFLLDSDAVTYFKEIETRALRLRHLGVIPASVRHAGSDAATTHPPCGHLSKLGTTRRHLCRDLMFGRG